MFRRLGFYSDEMLLAFAVWLCNLPLVALVVIPTFGWWAAGVTALALFFVFLVICWGVCGWKIANSQDNPKAERR